MSNLLIFKCPKSHGTMKYTLKAHACLLFCFDGWALTLFVLTPCRFLHFRRDLLMGNFFDNGPPDFYTSENVINIKT
jgi:hypothetical protein